MILRTCRSFICNVFGNGFACVTLLFLIPIFPYIKGMYSPLGVCVGGGGRGGGDIESRRLCVPLLIAIYYHK